MLGEEDACPVGSEALAPECWVWGRLRREPSLPAEYIPELEQAAHRAGLNWKDFQLTDNSCKPHPPAKSILEKARPHVSFFCRQHGGQISS